MVSDCLFHMRSKVFFEGVEASIGEKKSIKVEAD
jgi:hypothetical protein